MDPTAAHIVALSLTLLGAAVVGLTVVAITALRRSPTPPTQHITATSGAQVTIDQAHGNLVKPARLPTGTIAALEDALAYLVQAKDIIADAPDNGAGVEDVLRAVERRHDLAAFILQKGRVGDYSPYTTVSQLLAQYRKHTSKLDDYNNRNGKAA